jgi:Sulfatase-modifying factor enzyme 1
VDLLEQTIRAGTELQAGMVYVRGGTFRIGSDRHYPEEAPVHHVAVDGFWIDRTPVTNAQFRRFVAETGHVTLAEKRPDPRDYPGALPHMLKAGSLVFSPRTIRSTCAIRQTGGGSRSAPTGAGRTDPSRPSRVSTTTRPCTWRIPTRRPMRPGRARACRQRPNGSSPPAAAWRRPSSPGVMNSRRRAGPWRTPGRASSRSRTSGRTATSGPRRSRRSRRTATASTT